jgi:tRNA pseudouridine55 synthase
MNGLLNINKPGGMTSRKVVDVVEQWFPHVRMGHAGTLDPLATGVLVLCLGQATRFIEYVQRMRKTYDAVIRLGATSDTDDADGAIQNVRGAPVPNEGDVRRCLDGFVGEIEQTPPAHSAAHVAGERAYDLARRGDQPQLEPRRVQIYSIHLVRYAFPELAITVECGKGTYIRSLARDVGQQLRCGGLVQALERTRIGPFRIEDAVTLDAGPDVAGDGVLPMKWAVADLAAVTLDADQLRRLRQGQRLHLPSSDWVAGDVAVYDSTGDIGGVARWDREQRMLVPVKMLVP